MTTTTSSGGRRKVSRSLLTGLVETFQSKKFVENFLVSSPSMEESLGWVVGANSGSSQQLVYLLKTKEEGRRSQKFPTIFAATGEPLLRVAGTEQNRQFLVASMAIQTYTASDVRMARSFLPLFREKPLFTLFLNGSTISGSVLA